jgi:hypothetical protein
MLKVAPKVGRRRLAAETAILTKSRKNLTMNKIALKLFSPLLILCWPGAITVYNSSSGRVQKAVLRARRRSYLPE